MSQIIAGLYEIQNQIGAGGGGVVYLGRHVRLEKTIVLKADKRKLSTDTAALRREVDLLKGLSHTYIPQVYDFVQEDGVVYTVMDYIDGESLDKLIGRNQLPTQPQVIKWACQLLEALSYLHKQPPYGILHGDIKPANIMLRPNGDVCLIDFNIALALGEEGAVKVGFSRGYASPEHYGADYISSNKAAAVAVDVKKVVDDKTTVDDRTVVSANAAIDDRTMVDDKTMVGAAAQSTDETLVDSDKTVVGAHNSSLNVKSAGITPSAVGIFSTNNSSKPGILLDVRSDIYSLGATLYHLISGQRPAQDAREVIPLGPEVCSAAVSAIIQKSMAPEPAMRYQTAEEMLTAFLQLHKKDKRVIRHKKRIAAATMVLTAGFLAGGATTFVGLKQLEQRQTALTLAEYSANELAEGKVSAAVQYALQAIPTGESILEAPVTAQAQKALSDALGVYDLSDGFKAMDSIELPAAPFGIVTSPEGNYCAAVYAYEVAVYDIRTLEKIASLPTQESALCDVVFADETHMIYAGEQGVTAYDLASGKTLWTEDIATTLALSADGTRVAAVNRDADSAVVYQTSDGSKVAECSFSGLHMTVAVNDIFADPGSDILALNHDGSMFAVSFYNGGLILYDLSNPQNDLILYEESEYRRFSGGFCGDYFAFTAEKSGKAEFGLVDVKKAVYVGGYEAQNSLMIQTNEQGIYLAKDNLLVRFDGDTLQEMELAYTEDVNITSFSVGAEYVLVGTDDNSFSFYDNGAHLMSKEIANENCDFVSLTQGHAVVANRNEPNLRLLMLENHSQSQLLSYDARYVHDEARISQDGRTAMLFGYENFRIYDMAGNLLVEMDLPNPEAIYDQQFRRDGNKSWLEVIWYDGTIRHYDATDGAMIQEERGQAPEKNLYEEFETKKYRIASSLHGAPEVYALETGKLITTLEEDSYLTYVTEFGDYIITEYINTAEERFGIVLDANLEKLAYLPNLCDVKENMLIFDYKSGNLRQCRLYSIQELIALGETY